MNVEEFWEVIEEARCKNDPKGFLTAKLMKFNKAEIVAFQNTFSWLHFCVEKWDIWGAAYLVYGGCSDDSFADFRSNLIMLGETVYAAVLKNADSFAEFSIYSDLRKEYISEYIAADIYEEKYQEDFPFEETNWQENMGDNWDFDNYDECLQRLPKLTKKHWKLERL
ncbi:DUF4240 domain-containing protein [Pseudoalteromonas spongiae]|uniref:DUF4240 domain-containing protein n=1 Tax=Pseudoalteromonas spongiae TaxID=298657 RepID=UPI000C2D28A4|nr:DUF4240 domain-containing protein [Pseudoalteromonas spongiae]